jgi:hypothetical protein
MIWTWTEEWIGNTLGATYIPSVEDIYCTGDKLNNRSIEAQPVAIFNL